MEKEKKILFYCGNKWSNNFTGISSLEVSRDLDIPHGKVRRIFKRFRDLNKGTLNDGVLLPNGGGSDDKEKWYHGQYISTIFYPGKEVLEDYYNTSKYEKENLPPFQKKLHQGHQKSEMVYFSESVLDRYLHHTDRYNIKDIKWGGFMSSNLDYLSKLPSNKAEELCCSTTRFGKIKRENGEIVIAATLEDLAALPVIEQQHWNKNLITEHISDFDPDFHKYYLRFFEGAPVDSHDPLHDLLRTIQKINGLPQLGTMFKNVKDGHLKYPAKNTHGNYCDSCADLYKIISYDNINTGILKRFLRKNFNPKSKELSSKNLFPTFLEMVGFFDNSIDELNNTIKNNELFKLDTPDSDYLTEFRKVCKYLFRSYSILYNKLTFEDLQKQQINIP